MAVVVPLAHARRVDERGGTVVPLGEALGPISPELALVDPALAARARALLPDPVEPVRGLPSTVEPSEPPEPPEPSESLRLPQPPDSSAIAASLAAACVVEDDAPTDRRHSSWPAVRIVGIAVLLVLALGLVARLGLQSLDDERSAVTAAEEPVEFSAPPTDSSLAPYAVAALERQARIEPRSALVREKLGTAYIRLERWEDAERELRALVALSPDDGFAHFALGRALDEQGRHSEAKEHFARAEELRRDASASVLSSP